LYIRNGAGKEDYFFIFAQRHFLYTGRYAQCRGTDSVLRTLAHLLAAHFRATPKQAKEPITPTLTKRIPNINQTWTN
jgi:hypothetical protein